MKNIFHSLHKANWQYAKNSFGNNHSTLIGLLVGWWIDANPRNRYVLEGGPGILLDDRNTRGHCDELFCEDDKAIGVLEVEGTRPIHTIRKLGCYLQSDDKFFSDIQFGLILFYETTTKGRGNAKKFNSPFLDNSNLQEAVIDISKNCQNKSIFVLWVDKLYENNANTPRELSHYYSGRVTQINCKHYVNGEVVEEIII